MKRNICRKIRLKRDWGLGIGDWEEKDFVGAFGADYRLFFSQRTQRRRGRKGEEGNGEWGIGKNDDYRITF
jgi:hypothetical protein